MARYDDDKPPTSKASLIFTFLIILFVMGSAVYFGFWLFDSLMNPEPSVQEILDNAPEVCMLPNSEWTWDIHNECFFYFLEYDLRIIQMPDEPKRELISVEMWEMINDDCVNVQNGEWENWSYMGFHGYCSNPQNLDELIPEFIEEYNEKQELVEKSEKGMDIEIGI